MRTLLALVMATLCFLAPALADDCQVFTANGLTAIHESTDLRVIAAVKQVRAAAHVTGSYLICELEGDVIPSPGTMVSDDDSLPADHILFMPTTFLQAASDRAVLGVTAHEYGHVMKGREGMRRFRAATTAEEFVLIEIDADRSATEWVGVGAVREAVEMLGSLVDEYLERKANEVDLVDAVSLLVQRTIVKSQLARRIKEINRLETPAESPTRN